MRRFVSVVASVALLLVASALTATSVSGAVVSGEHIVDSGSEAIENFCNSGVDFEYEFDIRAHFAQKTRGPGHGGALYFATNFHGVETYTNLDTDNAFSTVFRMRFQDFRITNNGDGTLTIVEQGSGSKTAVDDSGEIIFRDHGVTRFEYVVDYNGTLGNPDDDELVEEHGFVFVGGKYQTDRDFCTDALAFTA